MFVTELRCKAHVLCDCADVKASRMGKAMEPQVGQCLQLGWGWG